MRGPFLRVLETASTQKKADKIAAKLKNQGYHTIYTLHDSGSGFFQIGTFDETRLADVDKMDDTMYEKVNCQFCNTPVSKNRFFKCINCGKSECLQCGLNRLYGGQIPLIHRCGYDDFEFLADIGKCRSCGQPLGFRSAPQSLRFRMIAKVVPTGQAMMVHGMIATFGAEEIFIENEVGKIFKMNLAYISQMRDNTVNFEDWLKLLGAIKTNYRRMAWSTNYVVNVLGGFFGGLKYIQRQDVSSQKMRALKPYLTMMSDLTSSLFVSLANVHYGPAKLNELIDSTVNQLSASIGSGIDEKFIIALKNIRNFNNSDDFLDLKDNVDIVILPEQIIRIMYEYPATLNCNCRNTVNQ